MKMYPFSGTKHAHDIEFRRNRISNEIHDYLMKPEIDKSFDIVRATALLDQLTELLSYMHEGVCMIPGNLYGLANETVAWAEAERD